LPSPSTISKTCSYKPRSSRLLSPNGFQADLQTPISRTLDWSPDRPGVAHGGLALLDRQKIAALMAYDLH
jgi:hypothetical protein